ncbi:MAG: hypothetical protein Q4F11_10100, partial [Eubacteriales bacterium]|nr:hypothetical protein [Eubacteriales bacterium]
MVELRRIIDKWTMVLLFLVCGFTTVLFYQFHQDMEYNDKTVPVQAVYKYYNQMLRDYKINQKTMDEKNAKHQARAKVYVIRNLEEWNRLKAEDVEKYQAGNYEKRKKNYQESVPEVYAYYEELKASDSPLLKQYIEETDAIDAALEMWDKGFTYVEEYTGMIDTYIAQGDSMLRSSVYSDPTTFAHINILKSKHDFRKLYQIDIQIDNSAALEKVVEASSYVNIFIVFLVLICVFRFFDERKNGLIYVVHTAKSGRGTLACKRIFILAAVSLFSTVAVYFCQFAIAFHIYGGLEFMDNSLQSCPSYATICFTSSKWIFILVLLLLSASAVFMIGLFVWILVSTFSNITIGMGIVTLILGISYIMYRVIPMKSVWVVFKTINIWNAALPSATVNHYENVGVGTLIFDKFKFMLMVNALGIIIFSIGCYIQGRIVQTVRKAGAFEKIGGYIYIAQQKIIACFPQLFMELYKVLWVRKGVVVLGALAVIACSSGIKKGYVYDADMAVAMNYYREADGLALSKELSQIVAHYEAEQAYWNNRMDEIIVSMNENRGEYSKEDFNEAEMKVKLYQKGVDEIHRNIENMQKLEEKGMKGRVTSPFAVEEMLGKTLFDHQRNYGFFAIIGLIFLIFGVLSDESRQHMKHLIHTASKGRGKWITVKAGAALIITVIVWAVVYIPNLINVTKMYGVWGKTVIAQDYPILSHIPVEMSLD